MLMLVLVLKMLSLLHDMNRSHAEQAFRHLYVLATEPRCLAAIDVDTRQPVFAPVSIHMKPAPVPGMLLLGT